MPFALITAVADLGAIRGIIAQAWQATELFSEHKIEELVAETCTWLDERDLRWVRDTERNAWVAAGEYTQSLRITDNDEFPFAQLAVSPTRPAVAPRHNN